MIIFNTLPPSYERTCLYLAMIHKAKKGEAVFICDVWEICLMLSPFVYIDILYAEYSQKGWDDKEVPRAKI